MKTFGISYKKKKNRKDYLQKINGTFVIVLIVSFIVLTFFSKINNLLFQKNKIDIFKEDLEQIAFYTRTFDKELSKFLLTLDDIVQTYVQWENIFISKETEINRCRTYIENNKEYLKKVWFSNYEKIINLFSDLKPYQKEIFELMGKNEAFNYIVVLQNTNEKRPNGGFFGSFAFVKIDKWHIKELEIIDSYYPDFIAHRTRILAPERTKAFLPDRKIGFIAWNKFGFSDIDGKNIKDLYELMFNKTYEMRKVEQTMQPDLYKKVLHQNIKWVIFIRSDLLELLFNQFKEKARERQFLNASIDIIRKETRGNKKELYIEEIKEYFASQKENLIKNSINRFEKIANRQYITIYLSNVSTWLIHTLTNHQLTNVFSPNTIYFWDTNYSYNKIDGFVNKHIQITNEKGMIYKEHKNNDIVDISDIPNGKYKIKISYDFAIPETYIQHIEYLEKKYNIQTTDREKAILWLKSGMYEEEGFGKVRKRRETKATVYFPQYIHIENVTWEIYYQNRFYAPFANGIFYQAWSIENNSKRTIYIDINIKK